MKRKQAYAVGAAIVQVALLSACDNAQQAATPVSQATTATPSPATVPITGPKRTVLAFGDSLYAGYQLNRGEGLPAAIERRLRAQGVDARVIDAGVSGDTTAGGRRRLAYTLDRLERKPDLVLLGLGGNDALRQVDPAETRANMVAMLGELSRRQIPVMLTGMIAPPNLGPDYANRFNAIWPDLARQDGIVLDPFILDGVIGNRTLMLADGIHPNARGVARIADRLAPLVRTGLNKAPD